MRGITHSYFGRYPAVIIECIFHKRIIEDNK
uniref:Uncharacterized protein n=1 Tax=Anguilla anguilla TaxID=7936 RepID=A0A0E9VN69_ANGAN